MAKTFINAGSPAAAFLQQINGATENTEPAAADKEQQTGTLETETRTRRAQLVLKPSLYEEAKHLAYRREISFNELVIRLIEEELKKGE